MKKKFILIFTIAVTILCTCAQAVAKDRANIRDAIGSYGCKSVALTTRNGDVALWDDNCFWASGCPQALTNRLEQLANEHAVIRDVILTEKGSWIIFYNDNQISFQNLPTGLVEDIVKFSKNGETINSIAFRDNGDWVVVTDQHISCSSPQLWIWIDEGTKEGGALRNVSMSENSIVAVYERSIKYRNIPEKLIKKMEEMMSTGVISMVKIAGGSWFVMDNNGNWSYNM